MDFLKWYKNKVESNNLEPPEVVWENIQDDLDINQSWHLINNHLSEKSIAKRNYYLAIAASILVLFSVGSYWFLNSGEEQREFKAIVEIVNKAENNILEEKISTKNTLSVEETSQFQNELNETKNQDVFIAENAIFEEDLSIDSQVDNNEKLSGILDSYSKIDSKIILLNYKLNEELKIDNTEKNSSDSKERLAFRKLYVGATGQLANTWMLNEKTYSGLESYSLTKSNASFGSNFGIFIGTNIFKKIDLQLDINILAQNTQDYNEYINGHYISNTMKFNYTQTALSVRYNYLSKRFLKGEHGINIGSYFGYLHNAYQIIDDEVISLTDNYTSYDFGIFVAYEYIIPISRKLGLGTGVKAYYGLQNIYSGDEFIPSYMNNTNNASINISFSLKYNIR
ncbi:MAG: hypothetical protein GQ564_08885 [Bacteroidales bacterium]|nr:hypothetical protein [Bacteroidales bacterium]